ncbi:MAG: VOC family protein [Gammaproteobacteria bacterium]|nr:VOC family protein [Gammaproteobacteria bacterium]
MHKSRLGGVIIDCQTDDLEKAVEFWSRALGCPMLPMADPADKNYVSLERKPNEVDIEVQKVDHQSRVHIDIEADNIEAEVRRLEKLGAKRLEKIRTWVVMEAPTGHRFCVVSPQRSEFATEANRWD